MRRLEQTSIELSQLIHSETLPWAENPFRFVQTHDSTLTNDNGVFEYLQRLTEQMKVLTGGNPSTRNKLGVILMVLLSGITQTLLSNLEYLVSRQCGGELNWTFLQHEHRWAEALEMISHGQALGETQRRLEYCLSPSLVQYKRIETLFTVIEQLKTRWWKVLHPKWWSTIKQLATFFKGGVSQKK